MHQVLEIVTYRLNGGVSEADFVAASAAMEEGYLKKQDGYLKRTFGKAEGMWVDVVYWSGMEAVNAASAAAQASGLCQAMFGMLDMASVDMKHFEIVSQ